MCGRFACNLDIAALRKLVRAIYSRRQTTRRGYNIGPATRHPVLTHTNGFSELTQEFLQEEQDHEYDEHRLLVEMKWGLTRFKNTKPLVFNIRLETIHFKFKDMCANRCVIVTEGYYEWLDEQPYFIKPREEEYFYFACLYDRKEEFGIITAPANESMFWLHDRMPAFIYQKDIDQWIDPSSSLDSCLSLLKSYRAEDLVYYKVSNLVNFKRNDSSEVIMPLEEYTALQKSKGIARFATKDAKHVIEEFNLKQSAKNNSNLKREFKLKDITDNSFKSIVSDKLANKKKRKTISNSQKKNDIRKYQTKNDVS